MTNTNKRYNLISLVLTLIVIGLHAYLTKHYFDVKYAILPEKSICNINEIFNCDTVTSSSYAAVFGVPIAAFGLSFHFILLLLLSIHRFSLASSPQLAGRWAFYLSILSAMVSLATGTISLTSIGSLCIFCMACYVLSFILVFTIYKSLDSKFNLKNDLLESEKWPLVYLIMIPAIAWLGNNVYKSNKGLDKLNEAITEYANNWSYAPVKTFTEEGLTKGPTNAKMTIVEFADFLCPHCRSAAPSINNFFESHKESVRVIFKPYPLDGSCNAAINQKGDNNRCLLAKSVLCAEQESQKGWNLHEMIFEAQEELHHLGNVTDSLKEIFKKISLDEQKMLSCIQSEAIHNKILSLAQEGQAAGIQGTPAIFVNNKELEGGQFPPVLQNIHEKIKN